jgi:hypothetical protein
VDAELLGRLRRRYDRGVAAGISTNLSRPWHQGNHPGLQLAKRLKRKARQIQPVEAFNSTSSVNNSEGFFQL